MLDHQLAALFLPIKISLMSGFPIIFLRYRRVDFFLSQDVTMVSDSRGLLNVLLY